MNKDVWRWVFAAALSLALTFMFGCSCGGGGDDDDGGAPPAAPSDLEAAVTADGIGLTWTDNSDNESGFYVYRKSGGDEFTKIDEVGEGVTTYVDDSLECDGEATYQVTAYNNDGESDPSNDADPGLFLCAPSNLLLGAYYGATLDEITIALTWEDNSELEDGYRIEWKEADKADWEELDEVDEDETEYPYDVDCDEYPLNAQFRVVAFKDDADSAPAEATLTRGMGCFEDYTIDDQVIGTAIGADIDSSKLLRMVYGLEPLKFTKGFGTNLEVENIIYGGAVYYSTGAVNVDSQDNVHYLINFLGVDAGTWYLKRPASAAMEEAAFADGSEKACYDEDISCGGSDTGTTVGMTNAIASYTCDVGGTYPTMSGNEYVYQFTLSESGIVDALLEPACALKLFLLSNCNSGTYCLHGNTSVMYPAGAQGITANLGPGTYYLVVDGYSAANCGYTLTVNCITDFEVTKISSYGCGASMDLDQDENPMITSISSEPGYIYPLNLTYKTGKGWTTEKIEDNLGFSMGVNLPSVTVKMDSQDQPHVIYQKWDSGYAMSIMHAVKSSKGWTKEEIDFPVYGWFAFGLSSADIDANDNLHVSYEKWTGSGYTYDVEHAFKDASDWTIEAVDAVEGYSNLGNLTSAESTSIKTYPATDIETHIAYTAYSSGLRYATNASGAWQTYELVPSPFKVVPAYPLLPKVLVDADGYLYIPYVLGGYAYESEIHLLTNKPE